MNKIKSFCGLFPRSLAALSALIFLFNTSCARQVEDTTKLLIALPTTISKVITLTSPQLKHVVLNVSGPGIDAPVFIEWSAERPGASCTADGVCQLSVSRGNDRLVQVITIFEDPSGARTIHYGDTVKSLAAAEETISVTTAMISSGIEDASIQGRYLSSANGGPTGRLQMRYRPAGKPAMILGYEEMVSGWFRTFAVPGLKLEYLLNGNLLFGGAQALEDFRKPASVNVLEVRSPLLYQDHGSGDRYKRSPELKIIGFYGPGVTANHRSCYASSSGFVPGSYTAITGGTQITYDPLSVSTGDYRVQISAGRVNDCAGLTEFEQFLNYNPLVDSNSGARGLFRQQPQGNVLTVSGSGATRTATWQVLPGVEFVVQNFHVFLILNGDTQAYKTSSGGEIDCKSLYEKRTSGDGNAVYLGQTTGTNPTMVIGSQGTASSRVLICVESQDRILATSQEDSVMSGMNSTSTTSTSTSTSTTTIAGAMTSFTAPQYSITTSINLNFAWTNLTEVYITNTAGCTSGGTWTAIAGSLPWTLPATNASSTIYAKGRTASLNETSCLPVTSTHDNTPPNPAPGVSDGDDSWKTNQSPLFAWGISSDSGSGLDRYEISIGSSPGTTNIMSWLDVQTNSTYTATGLSLTRGQTYFLNVRSFDLAGNVSSVSSGDGWVVGQELWIPNGPVNAIAQMGKNLYLGGSFNKIGPWTGASVPTDPTTGVVTWGAQKPRISGFVYSTIPDGMGGYFVGGSFSAVNGVPRTNLARINSDGSLNSLNISLDGEVYAMATNGSHLYIGGFFTTVNSQSRNRLAAIDITGNSLAALNANIAGTFVKALDIVGSTLYVGGNFTSIGGLSRSHLGAIDTSTFTGMGAFNPGAIAGTGVYALAHSATNLYLAGTFTTVNGSTRNNIAVVDTTSGTIGGFNPSVNNTINALAIQGSLIYVGGTFTLLGGQSHVAIGVFDSAGAAQTWNPVLVGSSVAVNAIFLNGGTVYFGGSFTTVNSQPRDNAAAVDVATGTVATGWNPSAGGLVRSIIQAGNMIVSGDMPTFGGVARLKLAALDLGTGMPTSWVPQVTSGNAVNSLVIEGNVIYVGGDFTQINGTTRNRVAALDSAAGSPLAWNPNSNNIVYAMVYNPALNQMIIGGDFTTISGASRNRLAALDLATAAASAWDPNANSSVKGLILTPSQKLYVYGSFTTISAAARSFLASFNMGSGVVTGWAPDPTSALSGMALIGNKLWVGGGFTTIAGVSRSKLASFDTGADVLTSDNLVSNGVVDSVRAIGNDIVITGGFSSIDGTTRNRLARFNSDNLVISAWNPGASGGGVGTLRTFPTTSAVYVFGTYQSLGACSANLCPIDSVTGAPLP